MNYDADDAGSVASAGDHRRRFCQRSPSPPPSRLARRQIVTVAPVPALDAQDARAPGSRPARTRRGRFSRGSVIELGRGRRKRVEHLSVDDFVDSAAALQPDTMQLEPISVAHILHNHDSNTVIVGFHISTHQTQVTTLCCSTRNVNNM